MDAIAICINPAPRTVVKSALAMRARVYFVAGMFSLWPIYASLVALRATSPSAPVFVFSAALLVVFLLVGRWDMTGYYLRHALFLTFLAVTWWRWQWKPPVIIAAAALLAWRLIIRAPGKKTLQLSFPLAGGAFYVAQGGSYAVINQHHGSRSQQYALDITKLNVAGCRASGVAPRQLTQYWIFAETVYSPCDGIVTAVADGLPDSTPGEGSSADPAGNHLVIRYRDTDLYVGLAHLLAASLLVRKGDHVAAGQPVARVGNSGHSSEPHLHLHAKRGGSPDSMLDGDAVPLRFDGKWLVRNTVVRRASLQLVTPFPAHLESAARAPST